MHRKRILLAALLAALIVSITALTPRHGATAHSTAHTAPIAAQSGFTITSPAAGALVPCGQPITVTWTGGNPSDNVNLVLIDVQAFQVFQGFGVEPNKGSRVVTIGPGSCGRTSQFYVEDSPRTTWTYGPVFTVMCAQTFNIADGDVAGLIAAINSANASACPTTINLAPNGTYTLTSVVEGSEWPSGLPIVRTPITINGNGSTIQRSSAPNTPLLIPLVVSWTPEDPSKHPNLILDGVTLTGSAGPIGGLALSFSTALVRNSTITYNTGSGDNGGGIHSFCSNLTILNSTISYNTNESGFGGAGVAQIQFNGCNGSTSISFSTIYENRNNGWGRGDAIATRDSGQGTFFLKNSILASPTRGAGSVFYVGPGVLVSQGHNIAGDSSYALNGVGDMNNTNPLLGTLANNGGPTPTHLPLCSSPAIDAVPVADSTDVNGVPITTDQRGVSRPQGAASDIGAVEVAGMSTALTVTAPNDSSASADANCLAAVPDYVAGTITSGGSGSPTLSQSPAAGTLVGLGPHTVSVTAIDGCGNSGSDTVVFAVNDNTPPTITITAPAAGAVYLLNQSVTASYSCTDCGGIASCFGPVASGSNIDTASAGTKTFTVSASDNAGNSATPQSVSYTVSYGVRVLFDQSRAVKSGSTVPIKIELVDVNGNNVSSPVVAVHAVSVIQTSSNASVVLDDSGQANPDFDFRYDSSLGGYIFNLKTTGYTTGSYLLYFMVGGDPTSHSVQFQVRQ